MTNKIRHFRFSLNKSQKELADEIGIGQARLSEIENGKSIPSYKTRSKILEKLTQLTGKQLTITDIFLYKD